MTRQQAQERETTEGGAQMVMFVVFLAQSHYGGKVTEAVG